MVVEISDSASGSTASICVDRGFNCFQFQSVVNGQPVDVLAADAGFADGQGKPSHHGIPLLFPFPNRIRGGKFTWDGREYSLLDAAVGDDGAGNAIHGFCLDRPWRVVDQRSDCVVGQFQLSLDAPDRLKCWPEDCLIEVQYRIAGSALRCDVRVANPGDTPLPWGFGTHPYFQLPLGSGSSVSDCLVDVPAAREWVLDACLPTGETRPVSPAADLREGVRFDDLKLDDVLTAPQFEDGCLLMRILDEAAGLELVQTTDASFREIVVYTPPNRPAVCLEPYTCVTDAINLQPAGIEAGLRVLQPGQEYRGWIELDVRPILV